MSRPARHEDTPPRRCMPGLSKSSWVLTPAAVFLPSKTGRRPSSAWRPAAPSSLNRQRCSGSAEISAHARRCRIRRYICWGRGARADLLSISVAGAGQHQDTGSQVLHAAPETSCKILSKSIARDGGRNTFRGRVQVHRGSRHCKSYVCCDSLILDAISRCDAYPTIEVRERDAMVAHEASISKISAEQQFYLRSRGLTENEAEETIVLGFLEPLLKELPMCYAMPLNRLIRLEMSHDIGRDTRWAGVRSRLSECVSLRQNATMAKPPSLAICHTPIRLRSKRVRKRA
jgi:hypothetical protein